MPRLYNGVNEPQDYCSACWENYPPKLRAHLERMGDWDCDHPEYSDTEYTCDHCQQQLTDADN